MCVCGCVNVFLCYGAGPLLFWQKVLNGSRSKKTDRQTFQNGCQHFKMAARLESEKKGNHTLILTHTGQGHGASVTQNVKSVCV